MAEILVKASKTYSINIEKDLLLLGEKILPLLCGEKVAVITDSNVDRLFCGVLDGVLKDKTVIKIRIKSGEKSKNAKNFIKIINTLAKFGFTRDDGVIAFGGGVVGDLAGLVASCYMRGITLISIPTTLLSMIDSSVGGKTAIDLKYGKNLCGTFYQPSAVYISTGFLSTLPEREIKNGMGEAVKYAFLSDTVTAEDLKSIDGNLIYKCLEVKKRIVEEDEKESGKRALLNFGHTVGHAIEKLSGYTLPHGVCVAKGMRYAIEVSKSLYNLSEEKTKKMTGILTEFGLNTKKVYKADRIMRAILSDKKRHGEYLNFVAVKDLGQPYIERIKTEDLKRILTENESDD